MSNAQDYTDALSLALTDNGDGLERLRKALRENGYKETYTAAMVMLAEMRDADNGLSDDTALYYEALAVQYLPQ